MPAPRRPLSPSRPLSPTGPGSNDGSAPGTEASRRLLNPVDTPRPITLWGSSSMSSEGGSEATPTPIRIHEHLALATPAPVHAFGVSATQSAHALLMRGLDHPRVSPDSGADGSGATPVHLDPDLAPHGPLRCPGSVDGVAGTLDATSGAWRFVADDAASSVRTGTFRSALAEVADASRQVLWIGKNNILQVDTVLEHTQRMWDATADPDHDSLVLGQWPTENDAVGSATGDAVNAVNAAQKQQYGAHFVDLQALLLGEEGLTAPPVAHLQLLEQASTHEAIERGVTPPLLVATDHIHLNGWGNLLVSWAIVRRMRELAWL